MATRSLRSSMTAFAGNKENDRPLGMAGATRLASKNKTVGFRASVLTATDQNVPAKKDSKVGVLKPQRNVRRPTAGLTTRSTNITKAIKPSESKEKPVVKPVQSGATIKPSTANVGRVQEKLPVNVCDIDGDDKGNPQLVHEYVNIVHAYLIQLESRLAIKSGFLDYPEAAIKPKMRNLLMDWLVDVHQQFSLLQETLYQAVALVDRYLQSERGKALQRQELQLLGVTALFVASKYEEIYPPVIGDFVYISDNAYSDDQIRQMECDLLECMEFNLGRPVPIVFLRRYSKAGAVHVATHGLAKYIMELSVVEYSMAHVSPSKLAAASLALSMYLSDDGRTNFADLWTPTLAYYSTYQFEALEPVIGQLAQLLVFVHQNESAVENKLAASSKRLLSAVTKKYASKKLLKVSAMTPLKSDYLLNMATAAAVGKAF